jgi:hypothetical protein
VWERGEWGAWLDFFLRGVSETAGQAASSQSPPHPAGSA